MKSPLRVMVTRWSAVGLFSWTVWYRLSAVCRLSMAVCSVWEVFSCVYVCALVMESVSSFCAARGIWNMFWPTLIAWSTIVCACVICCCRSWYIPVSDT